MNKYDAAEMIKKELGDDVEENHVHQFILVMQLRLVHGNGKTEKNYPPANSPHYSHRDSLIRSCFLRSGINLFH